MVDDNRRQNAIQELGIQVLRYTGPDLRERPERVVAEVRAALETHTAGKRTSRPPG